MAASGNLADGGRHDHVLPAVCQPVERTGHGFYIPGLCLYLAGFLTGRDWLAGVGLALTSIRPQVTVLLAVPFLFRRQKVFGWFCLAGGVLGGISLAAVGEEGLRGFLNLLLVSASGEWYGLKEPLMVNLVGLLWRIAPGLGANLIHWTGWVVYGITLIGLCILWRRTRLITETQIGLAIVLAVFTVPHLHYHDLTLLLVLWRLRCWCWYEVSS